MGLFGFGGGGTTPLTPLGGWNASTNTPALVSSVGTENTYYTVTTAGNTTLNGATGWIVGDQAQFIGGIWTKYAYSTGISNRGVWNASTNTPALASGTGTPGGYYVVSTAGTTSLDGTASWGVKDWAFFDGTIWNRINNSDQPAMLSAFVPLVQYFSTDLILVNGVIYSRNTNGTSLATFALDAANWSTVANYTDVGTWVTGTYYPAGSLFNQGTRIIKLTTAGTSGAALGNTELPLYTILKKKDLGAWVGSSYYFGGEQVISPTGGIYNRNASGLSGAAFDATEAALYTYNGQTTISAFTALAFYATGQTMTLNGTIYSRITGGMTPAAFSTTEAALWNIISNYTNVTPWTASTTYAAGTLLSVGTRIIYPSAVITSAATFTAAEAANYKVLKYLDLLPWTANTVYYINEPVLSSRGAVLESQTTRQSNATFNLAEANQYNIRSVSADAQNWTGGTVYLAGELVNTFKFTLHCSVNHLSSATSITAIDLASWNTLTTQIQPWTASTAYYSGELAMAPNGDIIARSVTSVTGTVFDATEAPAWIVKMYNTALANFAGTTWYYAGDMMINAGIIFRRISGAVSAATFTLTEQALWQRIGTVGNGVPKTIAFAQSPYTLLATDEILIFDATGGNIVINLPTSATIPEGKKFSFTYTQVATNTITLTGVGTTVINQSTFLPGATYLLPGTTGQVGTGQLYLLGSIYYLNN